MTTETPTPAPRAAFDLEALTLGEVAHIESLSGQAITVMMDDERPKGLMLAALYKVARRRAGDPCTWDQALETPFTDANEFLGFSAADEADADDEDAAGPFDAPATPAP